MELTEFTMDRTEARHRAESYLELPEGTLSDEDKAVLAGYLALAQGATVIDVNASLRRAGLDENGRPRLALGRADWKWCHLRIEGSTRWDEVKKMSVPRTSGRALITYTKERHPAHTAWNYSWRWPLSVEPTLAPNDWGRVRSQVPSIPPEHRPKAYKMRFYWVMWEVEEWAETPAPPGDPFLLRPIGHGLAAVVAQWDLSPLEQAVLGMRA